MRKLVGSLGESKLGAVVGGIKQPVRRDSALLLNCCGYQKLRGGNELP